MALRLGCSLLLRRYAVSGVGASSDAILAQLCTATKSTPLWSSSCFTTPQFKSVSTSNAPFNNALADVIAEEITYERDHYIPDEMITKGPPAPFTLAEESGDTLLTLTRKFNDEEVVIHCMANDQPAPEDDANNLVQFNVTVNKGDQSLIFECTSDGTFLQIEHVACEPKNGFESSTAYTGPEFEELDENLKDELSSYLAQRGVDPSIAEYLSYLVHDKEQKEYMNWLRQVQKFVK